MYLKGLISKEHGMLMECAGYEFELKIESKEQLASAKNSMGAYMDLPDDPDINFDDEWWVEVYINVDFEWFFPAKELITQVNRKELPLLLGTNLEINSLVASVLKKDHLKIIMGCKECDGNMVLNTWVKNSKIYCDKCGVVYESNT